MAMSPQQLSDRFEIQDLIVDYAHAIDTKNWDALDDVFTADAFIDYSVMGGAKGSLPEIKEFLAAAMPMFPHTQHLVANMQVRLDGDRAAGRIMCHNPQVMEIDGRRKIFFLGLWYVDKYRRTAAGWRIEERVEEKGWAYNLPEGLVPILGDVAGE
jgi:3-phenylpropionate/cinnamic acid dioxygenase small subunit